MTAFFIFIHVIACILLGTIILMQSGRGGGLTESFASAGEMFGAKTNEMLVRTTTILSVVFFVTCLTLAILSAQRGKSLMTHQALTPPSSAGMQDMTEEVPAEDMPEAPSASGAME